MEKMKIEDALVRLRGEKRKFVQSFDVIISLKNIDLKKPENRVQKEVVLPHGRGKDVAVGIISDTVPGAMNKGFIESLSTPRDMKSLGKKYDFLLCEAPLMQLVGKSLGRYLAPVGKMPSPFPPQMKNVEPLIATKKKSVKIRVRDSPLIQTIVGTEQMTDDQIKENARHVIGEIEKSLPKGRAQIKDIFIKLTMSKPVKVEW